MTPVPSIATTTMRSALGHRNAWTCACRVCVVAFAAFATIASGAT